jgi:hypothetical protein
MKNAYTIEITKEGEDTLVSLTWVYGKPNENLRIEQLFASDSITFKELQTIISAMDSAVEYKKKQLSESK